jgi:hypothetical protein
MKVSVKIVLEVDPDAYRAEYGEDDDLPTIRADVKSVASQAVADYFDRLGYATVEDYR